MAQYLIKFPWTLRGFLNKPYMLINPTGEKEYPVRPMVDVLWNTLIQCDGKHDLEETRIIRILLEKGLIEAVPAENNGLTELQRYRLLPFEWKHTVQFSITGRCNLNCRHCFMASEKKRDHRDNDMTEEQLLHIIDQLPLCGVVNVELTGGEPLLSPHFPAVVKRLTERHVNISRILTNGVLLSDKVFDFLEEQEQKPQIVISFDGLDTHNWIRNNPHAQEQAMAAMALTVKRGFPLRNAVQVNRHTIERLVETCRFLKEQGSKSLFLIRTSETPRWAENAWVDDSLPYTDYFESCCQVAETAIAENWGTEIQVFNGFTLLFTPQPKIVEKKPCSDYESCFHRCGRAAVSFFIDHTGRVWPCDAFEGIGLAGGFFDGTSLTDRTMEDILSNSAYAAAMEVTLKDIRNANEECKTCEYFAICGGGCRAFGYGSSMFHEGGYAVGNGRLEKRAFTTCTYYRGGYAARVQKMIEEAQKGE